MCDFAQKYNDPPNSPAINNIKIQIKTTENKKN